jgi:ureidoglycolate lyase
MARPGRARGMNLSPEPMTAEAFAPYGEPLSIEGRIGRAINAGTSIRHDDVARLDLARDGGRAALHVFVASARALPLGVPLVERHPLGSQTFQPLGPVASLVVVAGDGPSPARPRAFLTRPGQGWSLARGVWHAPLAMMGDCEVLVIERAPTQDNLELRALDTPWIVGRG